MSLIYKALENAKTKDADLAPEQQTQQPDLAIQSSPRPLVSTKWAFGITALAAGGVLMLANAGQFGSSTKPVLASAQQTGIKTLEQSTLPDSQASAAVNAADTNNSISARAPNVATASAEIVPDVIATNVQPVVVAQLSAPVTAPVAVSAHQESVVETKAPALGMQEPSARPVAIVKPIVVARLSTPVAYSVVAPPRQETVVEMKTPVPLQQATFEAGVQSENKVIDKPRKPAIKPTYATVNAGSNVQQLSSRIVMHVKRPYETNLYGNRTGNANNAQKQGSVEHVVIAAKQAIRTKDFVSANINLHSLGDIAGTESMVYKRLSAYYLLSKGDKEAAASAYHDIVEMAPNDLEAGYNLALLEFQLGRMERARARIRFLKEEFPQSGAIDKLAALIKN